MPQCFCFWTDETKLAPLVIDISSMSSEEIQKFTKTVKHGRGLVT